MNQKRMKTAIIGCGFISKAYMKSIMEQFSILDLVAVCDLVEEKAKAAAEPYHLRVMTVEELLADASIELVINLTIAPAHYQVVKQLLEGGKHVYTEKVLAVRLEEAAELVALAKAKNLQLGVAPDTFLGSAIQTARFVIDSGMIGEVSSFSCALSRDITLAAEMSPFTTKAGGGIVFDVGIYYITALLSLLGPVRQVSGFMRTIEPDRMYRHPDRIDTPYTIEGETLGAATLLFENGVAGNMLFDANSVLILPEKPIFVIHGTLGVLYLADPNHFGGDVKVMLKGNMEPFTVPQNHAYASEARGLGAAEMAWAIRRGRQPRAGGDMGYHALEVLHGIGISDREGKRYDVQSTFERADPLPRGYVGMGGMAVVTESALAYA